MLEAEKTRVMGMGALLQTSRSTKYSKALEEVSANCFWDKNFDRKIYNVNTSLQDLFLPLRLNKIWEFEFIFINSMTLAIVSKNKYTLLNWQRL